MIGSTSCGLIDKRTSVKNYYTPPTPVVISDADKRYYDQLLTNYFDSMLLGPYRNFKGGILIAKGGTILYEQYRGFEDLQGRSRPLTANSSLHIASSWKKDRMATNQDVLDILIAEKPPRHAAPNKRFEYCNTNYVLLALLIEKISGLSYPRYMQTTIFDPLGMRHTFVYQARQSDRSTPSYQPNGRLWPLDYLDLTYGDKNIYSTPQDLLKWDQALGRIYKPRRTHFFGAIDGAGSRSLLCLVDGAISRSTFIHDLLWQRKQWRSLRCFRAT